jgi:hypothetical protein
LHRLFRRPCGHFLETPDGPDGPDFFFFFAAAGAATAAGAAGAAGASGSLVLRPDCFCLTILKFTLIPQLFNFFYYQFLYELFNLKKNNYL